MEQVSEAEHLPAAHDPHDIGDGTASRQEALHGVPPPSWEHRPEECPQGFPFVLVKGPHRQLRVCFKDRVNAWRCPVVSERPSEIVRVSLEMIPPRFEERHGGCPSGDTWEEVRGIPSQQDLAPASRLQERLRLPKESSPDPPALSRRVDEKRTHPPAVLQQSIRPQRLPRDLSETQAKETLPLWRARDPAPRRIEVGIVHRVLTKQRVTERKRVSESLIPEEYGIARHLWPVGEERGGHVTVTPRSMLKSRLQGNPTRSI
jgi:hypothetical protein